MTKDRTLESLPTRVMRLEAEIERLRLLLDWCRPRLARPAHRDALDRYRAEPQGKDMTPIMQSYAL